LSLSSTLARVATLSISWLVSQTASIYWGNGDALIPDCPEEQRDDRFLGWHHAGEQRSHDSTSIRIELDLL